MKKIKAVLFDLDGTLIDTERFTLISKVEGGKECGYDISFEDAKKTLGLSRINSDNFMRSRYGEDVPVDYFRKKRKEMLLEDMKTNGIKLKPGVLNMLDFLDKKGIKKAICTSTISKNIEEYKKYSDIFFRFDEIITSDMVTNGKPNPEIFLKGAEKLNVSVKECLVIEDSSSGVEAAIKGNFKIITIPDLGEINQAFLDKIKICKDMNEAIRYIEEEYFSK